LADLQTCPLHKNAAGRFAFLYFNFQFIDAANCRKFTIANDKLQMNGMGFAHDFKLFSQKTPQFVICNSEL